MGLNGGVIIIYDAWQTQTLEAPKIQTKKSIILLPAIIALPLIVTSWLILALSQDGANREHSCHSLNPWDGEWIRKHISPPHPPSISSDIEFTDIDIDSSDIDIGNEVRWKQ